MKCESFLRGFSKSLVAVRGDMGEVSVYSMYKRNDISMNILSFSEFLEMYCLEVSTYSFLVTILRY